MFDLIIAGAALVIAAAAVHRSVLLALMDRRAERRHRDILAIYKRNGVIARKPDDDHPNCRSVFVPTDYATVNSATGTVQEEQRTGFGITPAEAIAADRRPELAARGAYGEAAAIRAKRSLADGERIEAVKKLALRNGIPIEQAAGILRVPLDLVAGEPDPTSEEVDAAAAQRAEQSARRLERERTALQDLAAIVERLDDDTPWNRDEWNEAAVAIRNAEMLEIHAVHLFLPNGDSRTVSVPEIRDALPPFASGVRTPAIDSGGAIDAIAKAAGESRCANPECVLRADHATCCYGEDGTPIGRKATVEPTDPDPSPAPSCHVDGACSNGPECWVCPSDEEKRARAQQEFRAGVERAAGADRILPRAEDLDAEAPANPVQDACDALATQLQEQKERDAAEDEAVQEVHDAIEAGVADAQGATAPETAEGDEPPAEAPEAAEEPTTAPQPADAPTTETGLPGPAPKEGGADAAIAALNPGKPTPAARNGRAINSPIPVGWHKLDEAADLIGHGVTKQALRNGIDNGKVEPGEARKHPSAGRYGYTWIIAASAIERIRAAKAAEREPANA